MSDPVTNVEIEDVLSSIRRLVAQGDKPRGPVDVQQNNSITSVAQPERFVLTPALRVADVADEVEETESDVAEFVAPASALLVLTPADAMKEPLLHDGMSASERESLEATIAELEAAVTSQPDEWEPDGSEVVATTGLADAFAAMENDVVVDEVEIDEAGIENAQVVPSDPVVTLHPQRAEPTFRHVQPDDLDTDYGDELRESDDDGMPIPDDLDETLAAYIAGGSKLEREEMRKMVVEVVRQELQGDLGERITRNIRKLVRKEINRAMTAIHNN